MFSKRDRIRAATSIGISLLLHASLFLLFRTHMPMPPKPAGSAGSVPLVVELNRQPLGPKTAPPPPSSPPNPPSAQAPPPRPAIRKRPAVRPPAPPPVAQLPRSPAARRPVPPKPASPAPGSAPSSPSSPSSPSPPSDMSEMVAAARARRRAAGVPAPEETASADSAQPQGDEVARANVARSVAQARGPRSAGGVFQIVHMGVREAEFLFRGWDNDSRAIARQLVKVDAGPNGNVEDAIVRKMIAIIRAHQPGDFNWDSQRLGRVVVLSARKEDNAGLEEFLKKEFFDSLR